MTPEQGFEIGLGLLILCAFLNLWVLDRKVKSLERHIETLYRQEGTK